MLALIFAALVTGSPPSGELLEVKRLSAEVPHSAFTDMVVFHDTLYCAFREASQHLWDSTAAIRILSSGDGESWSSSALLTSPCQDTPDLRDPKILTTPDGELMIVAAAVALGGSEKQTIAWFSPDGRSWGDPTQIGERNIWIWDITWYDQTAYGIGYSKIGETLDLGTITRLYSSPDGIHFQVLVDTLFGFGLASEASLVFLENARAVCLLRRDTYSDVFADPSAQLGFADPPYMEWSWISLDVRVGGPNMLQLPDSRIVVGARLVDEKTRTSVAWLDIKARKLTEFLELPSGGDTGYPGLAFHNGQLYVSYYSSHEDTTTVDTTTVDTTAIYLARVLLHLPVITVEPQEVLFDATMVGDSSEKVLTVTNTGDADLTIFDMSVSNPAFILLDTLSLMPPGISETVRCRFRPRQTGDFTATILLDSDAHPNMTFQIPVSGTGVSVTEVNESGAPSPEFRLGEPYPYPFNALARVPFAVPTKGHVRLIVYTLTGQAFATVVDEVLPPGSYETIWDGCDSRGEHAGSGIYLLVLRTKDKVVIRKVLLLR